jgi:hypothetical protein
MRAPDKTTLLLDSIKNRFAENKRQVGSHSLCTNFLEWQISFSSVAKSYGVCHNFSRQQAFFRRRVGRFGSVA